MSIKENMTKMNLIGKEMEEINNNSDDNLCPLTEEEIEAILLENRKIEEEEYGKQHTMICPNCGERIWNIAPNGAGIMEECDFVCDVCNWREK